MLVWEGSVSMKTGAGGKKRSKEEDREIVYQEAVKAWGRGVSSSSMRHSVV